MPQDKPGTTQGGGSTGSGGGGYVPGGTTTTTTTTSSSGGGTGTAQANDNTKKFFLNTLKELGIAITPNLTQLVNNAIAKKYNAENFMFYLRQTKEYHQRFTGIFRKDGTLKMSEAQYLSNLKQYENIASKAGINLNGGQLDWMFMNNVSPSEFADRAVAYSRLNRNQALYNSFRAELIQRGVKPKDITKKGLLRFILGEGNKQWYDVWQDAVTRNAATQAGLAVGKKNALEYLPQGLIERISGMGLSESALNKGFEQLADDIANLLPDSRFFGSGLTTGDFVTLRFGGKGRQAIADKVKEIQAQRNLANEPKANAQLIQTSKGGSTLAYGGLAGETGE